MECLWPIIVFHGFACSVRNIPDSDLLGYGCIRDKALIRNSHKSVLSQDMFVPWHFIFPRKSIWKQVFQRAPGPRTAHQLEVAVHGVKRCGPIPRLGRLEDRQTSISKVRNFDIRICRYRSRKLRYRRSKPKFDNEVKTFGWYFFFSRKMIQNLHKTTENLQMRPQISK